MDIMKCLGQGYQLDHLNFDNEMQSLEDQIETMLVQLENTEAEEVEKGIENVKEALIICICCLKRKFLRSIISIRTITIPRALLADIADNSRVLRTETEIVKLAYHMSEAELEKHRQAEEQLTKLFTQFEQLELKISQQDFAQSLLSEELAEIRNMLEELEQEQEDYREILNALRKDELQRGKR